MGARKLLRAAFGIAVSVVCLFLLSKTMNLEDVWASLRQANPIYFIPAVVLYFAGTAVRSLRWQKLLPGHKVPLPDLFRALVIGLTLNDVLPARLGEVARVFLISRHGVPVGTSLAAIVVERVLDGLALTTLVAVGIVLSGATGWIRDIAAISGLLFAVITAVLLWAAFVPRPARWLGLKVIAFLPPRLHEPLERLMDTGLTGLRAIGQPVAAFQVLGLSLLAWILEAGMYRVVMEGFNVPGGIAAAVMGTGVANLATLIPASPGYVGTFDAALTWVLVNVFSSPSADAGAYTIAVHVLLIVPVVLLGLFFIWREDISLPDIMHRGQNTMSRDGGAQARPDAGGRDGRADRGSSARSSDGEEAVAGHSDRLL